MEKESKKNTTLGQRAKDAGAMAGKAIHRFSHPGERKESDEITVDIEQKAISQENIEEEEARDVKEIWGVAEIKRNIKDEITELLPIMGEVRKLLESLAGGTGIKVAYLKGERSWDEMELFPFNIRHLLVGAHGAAEELEERLNRIMEECLKVKIK
ncbi:MAG: hypothetical protein ABH830_03825 [Patescibacteria group bacterium]